MGQIKIKCRLDLIGFRKKNLSDLGIGVVFISVPNFFVLNVLFHIPSWLPIRRQ